MYYKKFSETNKQKYLEDLFGLLEIDSVLVEDLDNKDHPFGKGTVEALNYCFDIAKKHGFKTVNIDNKVGYIEYGAGEELVAVLCHLDVVPTGEGWTKGPFSPFIKDGKLFARGANDDKGPAMSALYALIALKEKGIKPNKKIRLILGLDEETGFRGVKRYLEKEGMPTVGFSPDAEYPIIYAEKGIMSVDILSKGLDKDDVLEELKAGDRYNVVPEKAYAKVNKNLEDKFNEYLKKNSFKGEYSNNNITLIGQRAHAMEPLNGVNALVNMCKFLSEYSSSKLAQYVSKYLKDSRMKDLDLQYTHKEMKDLTMNVAFCDINKEQGRLGINFRYPIGWEKEKAINKMKSEAEKLGLELVIKEDSHPHYVDPNSDLIKDLHQSYIKYTGDDKTPLLTIGGGTYARVLDNAVAFGCLLPGREEVAHQVDEYMHVEDLVLSIAILADAIERLAK